MMTERLLLHEQSCTVQYYHDPTICVDSSRGGEPLFISFPRSATQESKEKVGDFCRSRLKRTWQAR